MTTQRQIEANRRNAQKSTGPNTPEGKDVSRRNAFVHGFAGEGDLFDEVTERKIEERARSLRDSFMVVDPIDELNYREMVVNIVLMERARAHESRMYAFYAERAEGHWDDDRIDAVHKLAARIKKDPRMVAHRLAASLHGCDWLIDRWGQLLRILESGRGFDDVQRAVFQDLGGEPNDVRDPDDPIISGPGCPETIAYIQRQIADLQARRERSLVRKDEMERSCAMNGVPLDFPEPLRRMNRYAVRFERNYHRAMNALIKAGRYVPGRASAPPRPTPIAPPPEVEVSLPPPQAGLSKASFEIEVEPLPQGPKGATKEDFDAFLRESFEHLKQNGPALAHKVAIASRPGQ